MASALQQTLAPEWSTGAAVRPVPAWYRERQRRALAAAQAAHWPARGAEAWKYTSLHALAQRTPDAAESVPEKAPESLPKPGLRFRDGVLDGVGAADEGIELVPLSVALASDDERLRFAMARESEDGDVFDRINAAFASEGTWLQVATGARDPDWLRLTMAGGDAGDDRAWHLQHRVDVGAGSSLRLLIELADAAGPRFATVHTRIRVQRDATLDLAWCSAPATALSLVARTRIELERGARLRMNLLDGGAAPSRHDLAVALRGAGACSELGGVFLLDGRRHADLQLDLHHEQADTTSSTVWRAVADERSRAVVDGRIVVAAGADGTDARLSCKSLLGSPQAEVDVRPVLEILADDVKCAHGATVGQLDPAALFYLRARGLPPAQAQALLRSAFCVEAFRGDEATPVHQRLAEWLDGAVQ